MVSMAKPVAKTKKPAIDVIKGRFTSLDDRKRVKGSIMSQTAVICKSQNFIRLAGLFRLSSKRSSVFVMMILMRK